jgi:imidazolonepropionase-like amidohydrolase
VTRAVQAGVRSIEHGNLIDEATARVMKTHGAYLVPTLATYVALADEGERLGWSAAMLDKLKTVHARGIESLRIARPKACRSSSAPTCSATCTGARASSSNCACRAMTPVQVLQSATIEAARLMREQGQIGELVPGAWADLLVVDGDPTQRGAVPD